MSRDPVTIRLEPWGTEIEVARGTPLISALAAHGVEFPCGGTGSCGGCRVRVLAGALPVSAEDRIALSEADIAQGWRLACQARAEAPLMLECGQARMEVLADDTHVAPADKHGLGIAVDLGTTTIAAQLVDLSSGDVLAVRTALNPQARFGADVMSRVRAVLCGADLTSVIRMEIGSMVAELGRERQSRISEVVLVGNTVMHHLFCGLNVEPLSHVPFASPSLGERQFSAAELGWSLGADCAVRFIRCIGGFVGSDILAGIVAAGIGASERPAALIDLGTNGEIVVANRNRIVCASTAAGPAFEAGCIRMGMRAAPGAISHVWQKSGRLEANVIGDGPATGICGSGVVDAVAAGLRCGAIAASGRLVGASREFKVADPVVLFQSDIRELQLAKGAIASGLRILLAELGINAEDLARLDLAGAFGNYVRIASAVDIGLLELPESRIHAAGNTALRGAKMLLAGVEEPGRIEHVSLADSPRFEEEFVACMGFPGRQACAMGICLP